VFGIHDLLVFIAAALLLIVTPGPDTALVVGQSLRHGARGGVLAALGVVAGCCVHVTAAAIGFSALLLASAAAFNAIKWIGVCYLAFIGVRMMFAAAGETAIPNEKAPGPAHAVFWQGFFTNVLNPKVALFFLAFLPQFIDGNSPDKAAGFVLLGLMFTVAGAVWLTSVALMASRSVARLGGFKAWFERLIGAALVAVAARLVFAERS
jgi:threonine/homoserine/homoserine lactone efflux protein